MEIEIAIEGPAAPLLKLQRRLTRRYPAMERLYDPVAGDLQLTRVCLVVDVEALDETLFEISGIIREVEREFPAEERIELRTRNLAYGEPSIGGEGEEEPYRPVDSLTILPWRKGSILPGDAATIVLDPRNAFGTGRHPTTRLCLGHLDRLAGSGDSGSGLKGKRVLDFGCGTGLLAIAAVKMGAGSALGVEIDPVSARTAETNAALNGVRGRVLIRNGSWEVAEGRFDLILANAVPSVLLRTGQNLPGRLDEHGEAVISGFSEKQAEEIKKFFTPMGLNLKALFLMEGWAALVFSKA